MTMIQSVLPNNVTPPEAQVTAFTHDRTGIPAAQSTIRASTYFPDRRIEVNPTIQGQELTILHELGHVLDYDLLPGSRDGYKRAIERIKQSRTIKALEEHPTSGATDVRHKDYLLHSREVFARAFAQYIATKAKNPKATNAIDLHIGGKGMDGLHQWPAADFEKHVGPALDEFFAGL